MVAVGVTIVPFPAEIVLAVASRDDRDEKDARLRDTVSMIDSVTVNIENTEFIAVVENAPSDVADDSAAADDSEGVSRTVREGVIEELVAEKEDPDVPFRVDSVKDADEVGGTVSILSVVKVSDGELKVEDPVPSTVTLAVKPEVTVIVVRTVVASEVTVTFSVAVVLIVRWMI